MDAGGKSTCEISWLQTWSRGEVKLNVITTADDKKDYNDRVKQCMNTL